AAGFFSAAFFDAQRCLAASAIFFRDAALITRFFGAVGKVEAAGFRPGLVGEEVVPSCLASSASRAAIAWSMRSRSERRAARIAVVSICLRQQRRGFSPSAVLAGAGYQFPVGIVPA